MKKKISATASVNVLSGVGTITVKVPGTFAGFYPSPGATGRLMILGELMLANQAAGDKITSFILNDTDGVIPQQARAQFPNYPELGSLIDETVDAANQSIYFLKDPLVIEPVRGQAFVPSGIYIKVSVQKAVIGGDTIYANITWDDLS